MLHEPQRDVLCSNQGRRSEFYSWDFLTSDLQVFQAHDTEGQQTHDRDKPMLLWHIYTLLYSKQCSVAYKQNKRKKTGAVIYK